MLKFLRKTRVALSLSLACLGMSVVANSAIAQEAETTFYSTRNHLPDLKFNL